MHKNLIAKALISVVMIAALTLTGAVPSFAAAGAPKTDASSVILMDASTGEIIYEKNAREKRDPASVTKILNCLVVLDNMDLDEEVTIDFAPETEGSVIKLQRGEKLTIRDLLYGMMISSGNDAAEALAILTAGNVPDFCDMMNEKAAELGATDTKYKNPNGLNPLDGVNNITTAYDVATVIRSAVKNPQFAEIVSTPKYYIEATNKSEKRKLINSNRCLWDKKTKVEIDGEEVCLKYEGCQGVKTGYSSTAGDCFAGFAKRGNTGLIAVVLNASHEIPKFRDAVMLWDYGFENFRTYTVAKAETEQDQLKIKAGSLREVAVGPEENLDVTVGINDSGEEYTCETVKNADALTAPVAKGEVVGYVIARDASGKEAARRNLIALETAEKGGPLSQIGIADEDLPVFLIVVLTALLILIVAIILIRQRRKNG